MGLTKIRISTVSRLAGLEPGSSSGLMELPVKWPHTSSDAGCYSACEFNPGKLIKQDN